MGTEVDIAAAVARPLQLPRRIEDKRLRPHLPEFHTCCKKPLLACFPAYPRAEPYASDTALTIVAADDLKYRGTLPQGYSLVNRKQRQCWLNIVFTSECSCSRLEGRV